MLKLRNISTGLVPRVIVARSVLVSSRNNLLRFYGGNSSNNGGSWSNRPNNRGNSRGGFNNYKKNDRYENKRDGYQSRGFVRKERDPDEIQFDESTLAKLVHVPKDETAAEVTLDGLFNDNVIDALLHKSISRMGFDGLTTVQQKTIKPIVLDSENDVIARAKTGTGKTFAFLVPIFQHLINTQTETSNMVKAVIVAPTRDLALQIESEVKKIHDNNHGLKKFDSISLVGGTNFGASMSRMYKARPNIVIATPGRLLDVLDKYGDKFFKSVDFKVLDEADRLLEIGFKEDLENISNILNGLNSVGPEHIRTLLFSATLDEKVQKLSNRIMNKKSCLFIDTVDKNEPEAHEKIQQSMVVSKRFVDNIYAAVQHIRAELVENPNYKAILFTPTVKFTKFISEILYKELKSKIPVLEFHGKVTQGRRTSLVKQFKREKAGLLVCTDVGARGMDFPNVQEVLQIGVPSELSNYIHRIGRTARSGKDGKSTIFVCDEEMPFIETLANKKNIIITDKKTFQENEKIVEDLKAMIEDPEELKDALISLISYYRSGAKEYGFNERRLLPEITSAYGILLQEPELKMRISRSFLDKLGLQRSPVADKMFDISSSRFSSEGRDFGDRSDRFSNNDRYSGNKDYNHESRNKYNDRGRYNSHGNQRTDKYNKFDK